MDRDHPRLERGPLLALFDEAVTVARGIFGRVYLPLAVAPVLASAVMSVMQSRMIRGFATLSNTAPDFGSFAGGILLTYASFFLFGAVSAVAGAGMVAGASWHLRGEPVSAGRAWRWALRGRTLGTLFITMIFVGVGMMLCFLPGIYLAVVYAVAIPVLAWEDISGYSALSRSRELVIYEPKRRLFSVGMGWVVMAWITTMVLTYGVSLAIQLPLSIVQQILMVRNIMGQVQQQAHPNPAAVFTGPFMAIQTVVTMLSTLGQQLVALFSSSAFALLYLRLRGRKEGTDLVEALDRLGAPA